MNFPKFPLVVGLYLIPVLFENIVCMVSTSPFKFTEACLRTYHTVCPGEFYVCAGGECASWCYWVKQVSVRSSWRIVFILYLCWYSALFFYPFLFFGFFSLKREWEPLCARGGWGGGRWRERILSKFHAQHEVGVQLRTLSHNPEASTWAKIKSGAQLTEPLRCTVFLLSVVENGYWSLQLLFLNYLSLQFSPFLLKVFWGCC